MKFIFLLTIPLMLAGNTFAQTDFVSPHPASDSAFYNKPKKEKIIIYKTDTMIFGRTNLLTNIKDVPFDMWQMAKSPFHKKSIIPLSAVAVSTGILIWQDQNVLDGVRQFCDNIGLNPETKYKNIITIGDTKVLRTPKNLNTALYEVGLGGTSMVLAGGIWVYGKLTHDQRNINVACDLTETFITMGLTTQLLKRISGRESPFQRTAPGGRWRPFPSFSEFQNNTPNYDAFPSGHLATIVATVTVLATDYPEKKWILPVGCAIAAGSALAMVNTEVHWAGDYPLAIAIGYLSGKITTWRHKKHTPMKTNLF